MAPVTRRAAKAGTNSPTEGSATSTPVASNETPLEKPIALRSRRNERGVENAKVVTPKSKKLEVRIREDGSSTKKAIEVQIPSSALKTPRSRSSPVPDSQEANTGDDGDQNFEPLSASKQLEEEASQKLASQSRLRESGVESTPVPKTAKSTRGSSAKKTRGETTLQSESQSQSKQAEPDNEATPRPKATKSSHVVFGDDDDVDKFVAAAAEKEGAVAEAKSGDKDEEGQEDSDDEAPEAVSTVAAAKETLQSAKAAIKAAEEYAATTKRKRQARDDLLKQQAEKRKRTKPSASKKEDLSEDDDEDESNKDDKEEDERNKSSKRQRRTQKPPEILPVEFLTDSSDDEDDEGTALKKMLKRPQKINFETAMQVLDAEGKKPRDEVVGSRRYRVLAQQGDPRLAPKADNNSLRSKEALLRRGRTGVAVNKKRGFFVKR
ncbi:hypothetical protein F5B22DRAFT_153373 [Xylaria bambusicola]|uniref:uncharacterized protein n=1 Tax=Xylaria bambusicola TaxID=326684 RepID=UPI00200878C8|nr:uncharacterized protein F5B22DRAFT_153373 [Xylaria bambusicola]KAI0526327.1 hypothetical protein F5B22DRAFT_153373 [Xylaria bambusicola]